jgi:hypothetical protein
VRAGREVDRLAHGSEDGKVVGVGNGDRARDVPRRRFQRGSSPWDLSARPQVELVVARLLDVERVLHPLAGEGVAQTVLVGRIRDELDVDAVVGACAVGAAGVGCRGRVVECDALAAEVIVLGLDRDGRGADGKWGTEERRLGREELAPFEGSRC